MINFFLFVILQGLAINGFQQAMDDGMILSGYKSWLKKRKSWIGKMGGLCIKCSASIGSSITFWPTALYFYGWNWFEVLVWVFDALVLISVNWLIFKKL
jgi:hypothetical protein